MCRDPSIQLMPGLERLRCVSRPSVTSHGLTAHLTPGTDDFSVAARAFTQQVPNGLERCRICGAPTRRRVDAATAMLIAEQAAPVITLEIRAAVAAASELGCAHFDSAFGSGAANEYTAIFDFTYILRQRFHA